MDARRVDAFLQQISKNHENNGVHNHDIVKRAKLWKRVQSGAVTSPERTSLALIRFCVCL